MQFQPIQILGRTITPSKVNQIIQQASAASWGTHLKEWKFKDVRYSSYFYSKGDLIPTQLWHLLKRIHVDKDWPEGTTLEQFDEEIRQTITNPESIIFVYGYYRTSPPRLQWGFYDIETGIAVVYDEEANLIVTVFKPVEGMQFFQLYQVNPIQIPTKLFF